MKIPDEILGMSKAKRREWIEAVDEVYEGYKKSTFLRFCPFCNVSGLDNCLSCLWKIIEQTYCDEFVEKKDCNKLGIPEPREDDYPKWKRIRYPMLRKWRRMLIEAGI